MKIIKVRRGYTTNSSAASEFVPPESWNNQAAPVPPVAGSAPGTSPAPPSPASGTAIKPFPIPVRPETAAGQAASPVAGAPIGQVVQQPQAAAPQAPGNLGSPGLLGGLAAMVGLAFVAERGIRAIIRRRRKDDDA
ncbi:MAG: hypothetical protein KDG52_01780 [Rhodocyclaceae bacterium]|nr:hypothetical protein [Rhodocyclaceae bacterium]